MHDWVVGQNECPGQQLGSELCRARLPLITARFGSVGCASHSPNQTIDTSGISKMANSQVLGAPMMHDSVSLRMHSHGPYLTVHQNGCARRVPSACSACSVAGA